MNLGNPEDRLALVTEPLDEFVRKIWAGIQVTVGEIHDLREDSNKRMARWERQAAEDRKQAIEDRNQATEDRKQATEDRKQAAENLLLMNETIQGIRKALAVIGKRGGEFVEIQKTQGSQLKKLIELTEKNSEILNKHTDILMSIQKAIHGRGNPQGNGRHR